MKHEEIKSVIELVELMNAEAEKWNRFDYPQNTVHGRGVKEQWRVITEKDEFPLPIFVMIHNNDVEVERPDGSTRTGVFEMEAFWFNNKGERVERPNLVIEDKDNG